jgi:transposase
MCASGSGLAQRKEGQAMGSEGNEIREDGVQAAEACGGDHGASRREVPETAGRLVRQVKRYARRRVGAEDKIRIVLEGLRGELSVTDLCRREGIHKPAYYKWLKSFMEGGKKRLMGDLQREANTDEVNELKEENGELKKLLAETMLQNRQLRRTCRTGEGGMG